MYGFEAIVVDDLVSCACEEVTAELCTGDTHSEVTDSEHEGYRLMLSTFGLQTQRLKFFCSTSDRKSRYCCFAFIATTARGLSGFLILAIADRAAGTGILLNLLRRFLGEVGELVGAEQDLFTFSYISETSFEVSGYSFLYLTGFDHLEESTLLLDSEELFPSLGSDAIGEVLDIVGTGSGVNDFIEVSFFLEQQLLVTCNTLCEVSRFLVGNVEGGYRYLVYTGEGGRHRLGLAAEEVDVSVEDSHIEARGLGAYVHLSSILKGGGKDVLFIGCYNLSPEQTCCAELSYLHEVVAADTHIEAYLASGEVVGYAGIGKHSHIVGTPS